MRTRALVAPLLALLSTASAYGAAAWRSEGPPLGTVYDLAVDSSDPAKMYALVWNGGLWRSDDGGATWTLPSTELVGRSMEWIEIDRAKPSTLWAGEKNPGEPALWRSTDRGATWKLVRDKAAGVGIAMQPVGYRIAFAPSRPTDIWVPSTNLHYRSRDGGKSWSDFRVPDQDAYAMAVDPKNADVVYAAGHGGEKFHFSRSDDNGKTWKATGAGLGPGIRSLVVDGAGAIYALDGGRGIWRSTDRGESWSAVPAPVDGTDDIWRLQIDPSNPKALWAATEDGLKKSVDGGATWTESDEGVGRFLVRAVAFDPRDSRAMWAAVSGTGIFRSSDAGATWKASNGGLSGAWIEGLEGSPRGGTLWVRASVGLYRRDAAGAWNEVQSPFADGKEADPGLFVDRRSPGVVWAFDGAKLWRSADEGKSWAEMKLKELKMRDLMKGKTAQAQFESFTQDPADPKVLYAGAWSSNEPGLAVSKSVDAGVNWKPAGQGLPGEAVDELLSEAPGVVYARVDDGLYRTDDGAASWKQLPGFPSGELRRLVIDPSTPARLYAATKEGLFRSTDSGATWTRLAGGIEKEDVEDVAVAPDGRLFAGHFHGVSESRDGGASWTPLGAGLPNTDVRAVALFGSSPLRLAVGTAGNGVFSTELP
jgi:photosystem II stability/assembly factor-like uncharacterized protein